MSVSLQLQSRPTFNVLFVSILLLGPATTSLLGAHRPDITRSVKQQHPIHSISQFRTLPIFRSHTPIKRYRGIMAPLRFNIISVSLTLIIVVVQKMDSFSLNVDKNVLTNASALMNTFSAECLRFAMGAGQEAIRNLSIGQACNRVKSDSFKSIALEACTKKEYDAAVALVCSIGSTDESTQHENSTKLNKDKDFGKSWLTLVTSFSLECKTFAVGSSTQAIDDLTPDAACSRVKSDSFKGSALEACTQNEYDAAVALACRTVSTGESMNQNISTTLKEDKGFVKSWFTLMKSFSLKCRTVVLGSSREPIGDLTHDLACGRVKSTNFKSSALEACSHDEFGRVVFLVCRNGSILNEDEGFKESWVALLKSFSLECQRSDLSRSKETMRNLTFDLACRHVKSDSFKGNALEACTQDDYDAVVALVCNTGSTSQTGSIVTSTTLNDDKDFIRRWITLVGLFSHDCRAFVYRVSSDSVADLTRETACRHARSDMFKSSALEACSHDEYDAAVDLVCNTGSTPKGHHGNGRTLNTDLSFIKSWVAFVKTLSFECREFAVLLSTGPLGDLTRDAACRRVKTNSFKRSALEACPQDEYGASVDQICGSEQSRSLTTLNEEEGFIERWIAMVELLSVKCKNVVLFSSTKSIGDMARDASCRRVRSPNFQSRAFEVCSLKEYDRVEKLVCPSGSSPANFAFTIVFLGIFLQSLVQE